MNKTSIETCEWTWNPCTGCDQVCFGGDCYAYQLMQRFKTAWGYDWTPQLHRERLSEPFHLKKPSLIFAPSMGDIMTPTLMALEIYSVIDTMMICDWHRFQIQTKYEKRLPEFKYPDNVWLGVSLCYERDLIRLEYLLETDARIKYAYCEPLLEEMDPDFTGIDWVVIGAKTGLNPFQPNVLWVNQIIKKAVEAGASVFMKSNLDPLIKYMTSSSVSNTLLREFPDKEWMEKAYPEGLPS